MKKISIYIRCLFYITIQQIIEIHQHVLEVILHYEPKIENMKFIKDKKQRITSIEENNLGRRQV